MSGQSAASSVSKQQLLRLQPAPSSRVTFNKTAGGRFTTMQDGNSEMWDAQSRLQDDNHVSAKPEQHHESHVTSVSDETDELDSTASPPRRPLIESSEARPPKAKRSLLQVDRNTDEARKRRRLSLREFASSSPIDLSNTPAVAPKSRQTSVEKDSDPLFRLDSPIPPKSTLTLRMDEGEPTLDLCFSDDEPAFSGRNASLAGHELGGKDHGAGGRQDNAALEEDRDETDDGAAEEEDDFDAWLAKSVVVM